MTRSTLVSSLAVLGSALVLVAVFCPLFHRTGGFYPQPDVTLLRDWPGWRELIAGVGALSLATLALGLRRLRIACGIVVAAVTAYVFAKMVPVIVDHNENGRAYADWYNRELGSASCGPIEAPHAAWAYGWLALAAGAVALVVSGSLRPPVSRYADPPRATGRRRAAVLAAVVLLVVVPTAAGFLWEAHRIRAAEAREALVREHCQLIYEKAKAWDAEHGEYPRTVQQMADAGHMAYVADPWGFDYKIVNRVEGLEVRCDFESPGEYVYPPR